MFAIYIEHTVRTISHWESSSKSWSYGCGMVVCFKKVIHNPSTVFVCVSSSLSRLQTCPKVFYVCIHLFANSCHNHVRMVWAIFNSASSCANSWSRGNKNIPLWKRLETTDYDRNDIVPLWFRLDLDSCKCILLVSIQHSFGLALPATYIGDKTAWKISTELRCFERRPTVGNYLMLVLKCRRWSAIHTCRFYFCGDRQSSNGASQSSNGASQARYATFSYPEPVLHAVNRAWQTGMGCTETAAEFTL